MSCRQRCSCATKKGNRCKNSVIEGSSFCIVHQDCAKIYETKTPRLSVADRIEAAIAPQTSKRRRSKLPKRSVNSCLVSEEASKRCINKILNRYPNVRTYFQKLAQTGEAVAIVQSNNSGKIVGVVDKAGDVFPVSPPLPPPLPPMLGVPKTGMPKVAFTEGIKNELLRRKLKNEVVKDEERAEIMEQLQKVYSTPELCNAAVGMHWDSGIGEHGKCVLNATEKVIQDAKEEVAEEVRQGLFGRTMGAIGGAMNTAVNFVAQG